MKSLLFLCTLIGVLASAQTPDAKPEKHATPALTAEQILERYIDARGGRERILAIKTMVKKGVSENRGLRMTFMRYRRAPNLYAHEETYSGGTRSVLGYDGHVLWVLPSKPLEQKPGMGLLFDEHIYEKLPTITEFGLLPYKKAKLRGLKKVSDRPAYVVELTREDDTRETDYFDAESFLLLRLDLESRVLATLASLYQARGNEPGADGRILVTRTSYYSDWRDVAGFKIPFEVRGETGYTKLTECQIDLSIDDNIFIPPPGSIRLPEPPKAPPK